MVAVVRHRYRPGGLDVGPIGAPYDLRRCFEQRVSEGRDVGNVAVRRDAVRRRELYPGPAVGVEPQ